MSNYAAPHQIADAIESLEWKGCSIGHKVVLANAVAALRATQPAAGEPVTDAKQLAAAHGDEVVRKDAEGCGAIPLAVAARTFRQRPHGIQ